MTLHPFFPYYGSKWSLGPLYPAPRHDRIIEPFAGSACYSLHHPERDHEGDSVSHRLHPREMIVQRAQGRLIEANRQHLAARQLREADTDGT